MMENVYLVIPDDMSIHPFGADDFSIIESVIRGQGAWGPYDSADEARKAIAEQIAVMQSAIQRLEAANATLAAERDEVWQALIGALGALDMTKTQPQYISDLEKQRNEAYRTNANNVHVLEHIKAERDAARATLHDVEQVIAEHGDDIGLPLSEEVAALYVLINDWMNTHDDSQRKLNTAREENARLVAECDKSAEQARHWRGIAEGLLSEQPANVAAELARVRDLLNQRDAELAQARDSYQGLYEHLCHVQGIKPLAAGAVDIPDQITSQDDYDFYAAKLAEHERVQRLITDAIDRLVYIQTTAETPDMANAAREFEMIGGYAEALGRYLHEAQHSGAADAPAEPPFPLTANRAPGVE